MSPKALSEEEVERIVSVKTYVLDHLQRQFVIRDLARRAALGEQKFKDGFYRLYERNVGEYIHEARMKTANFLLRNTNKSVKEIALLCGYKKTRNFSSAYKKFFGVNPKSERRNL